MRIVPVVLGFIILTASQCWAHGHSSSLGMSPQRDPAFTAPAVHPPTRDWEPETHNSKNPYEDMSCPELYVLATQEGQSPDLAQAFQDKDCHAL